ncbi:MAG: helix-turn-helix domain-containing protein [Polyangiaceae bacterium]
MGRLTRESWIEAGFDVLRQAGEYALTIERLSTALGRSKGSFYHHFRDMDDYLAAVLSTWEERNTSMPISVAEREPDMRRRRSALDAAVKRLDGRLDLAIRAWGLRDARARAHVAHVDARRIEYLSELLPRSLPRRRRLALARFEYGAFLGAQQLDPALGLPETRDAERLLEQALRALQKDIAAPSSTVKA